MRRNIDQILGDIAQALQGIGTYLPKAGALEKLMLPAEVAELLRVETETLESWRSKGLGPAFVKLARRDVRYRPSEVLRYIEERVCRSTWESAMRPPG